MTTPLRAIRKNCLECGGDAKAVKECPIEDCPLHKFRFGKNPNRAGIGNSKFRSKKPNSTSDFGKNFSN